MNWRSAVQQTPRDQFTPDEVALDEFTSPATSRFQDGSLMAAIAEAVKHMLAAGMAPEVIVAAIADMESAILPSPKVRSSHAERQARYRERKASQSVTESVTVTVSDARDVTSVTRPSPPPSPSPDKETSPTPPKENNLSPLPPPQPFSLSASEPFDEFWELFPNKVGKADARKKFPVALRKVSFDTLMEALRRYVDKTDDRPWCNPATWLHQERWGDQPAQVARGSPRGPKGLEWFDAAIDWIDEDERRRTEGSAGRDQDDAGGQGQRLIGHRS